jgi:glycosyltransferase involved in cell wall biosynthesis
MALRRDIVRAHRFDENLSGYGLGEDREMGYRLGTDYWLLEARRAHVVHRRDSSQRPDHRRAGYMTVRNYLYILQKTIRLGVGDWLLVAWGLLVLAAMHVMWALVGDRAAHLAELRGMIEGCLSYLRSTSEFGTWNAESVRSTPSPRLARSVLGEADTPHSPVRVLFVTNRLEPGGAERMLVGLVTHLPRDLVQSYVLCLKDAGPLAAECRHAGVIVLENVLRHKTDAGVIRRIQRIITDHSIDIVVVAHSGGDRMFWSTLAGKLCGAPIVVWSHWFPRSGRRHFERANRALYRCVDAFVALGERHRRALIRHEHLPAGRIHVIPNAVDLASFMHGTSREEARRRLRLHEGQLGVALIANLRREKRHDVFIQAAQRLSTANADLRFFVIGDGPDRDAVQAAAAASAMDHERLRLLGPRDDVPVLLSGMDICCLCSEVECFSVTMLEAAAAGCCFIGPNAGCLPEFVDHRRNGLLIKPADVPSLADAISELAGDAALRRRLTEEARRKVIRGFGMNVMAAAFVELFAALRNRAGERHRIHPIGRCERLAVSRAGG